ncbi:MAG: VWA domain-containing protein [Acidobacteriota bacterium]
MHRWIPTAPLLTAALLVGLSTASAVAQDDAPAEGNSFLDQVEVTEVLLDVVVTDRDGNVIVGLDADDFVVREAGGEVDLSGAIFYSNRRWLEENPTWPGAVDAVPTDRYFVLYLQDQKRVGGNAGTVLLRRQLEAVRDAKRWVRESRLGGDWVAVVSYDVKLKVHQDFTQDGDALIRALDRAARGAEADNTTPSRRPTVDAEQPSLLANLPIGGDALRDATRTPYDAFEVVAEALAPVGGRKNLVYIGRGFGNLDQFTGRGEPDKRYYPAMQRALNAHNVAVYALELVPSNIDAAQSDFLTQLTTDTGGRYYENLVNFATPLGQIADETSGYYLLSYRAEHARGDSGYREVEVDTRNPNFRVRAREGYRYGSANAVEDAR